MCFENITNGSSNPNNVFGYSELNISLFNLKINFDCRVEIGIIAQRQRRRFNQLRNLGIEIPKSYNRIFNVKMFPRQV